MPPFLVLTDTYGAIFIGLLISAVLFGITNLQMFIYFRDNPSDRLTHRISVVWLWCIDALHLCIATHSVYFYLITNYDNPLALLRPTWSFKLQLIVVILAITSVHVLYTIRTWTVTPPGRQKIIPIVVAVFVLAALVVGIVLIWKLYQLRLFTEIASIKWAIASSLAMATAADILIATSLCYILYHSRTKFSSTNSVISRLMLYVLNTGLLTSLCSLTALITCVTMPSTFVYVSVSFSFTRLYVNSYMALLNARKYLRQRAQNDTADNYDATQATSNPVSISLSHMRDTRSRSGNKVQDIPEVQISVVREQGIYPDVHLKGHVDDDMEKDTCASI